MNVKILTNIVYIFLTSVCNVWRQPCLSHCTVLLSRTEAQIVTSRANSLFVITRWNIRYFLTSGFQLSDIFQNSDIMCLSEHCLSEEQKRLLSEYSSDHDGIVVCSNDNPGFTDGRRGMVGLQFFRSAWWVILLKNLILHVIELLAFNCFYQTAIHCSFFLSTVHSAVIQIMIIWSTLTSYGPCVTCTSIKARAVLLVTLTQHSENKVVQEDLESSTVDAEHWSNF